MYERTRNVKLFLMNMVYYIRGEMKAKSIGEQDPEVHKREENGERRKLYNKEIHSSYY